MDMTDEQWQHLQETCDAHELMLGKKVRSTSALFVAQATDSAGQRYWLKLAQPWSLDAEQAVFAAAPAGILPTYQRLSPQLLLTEDVSEDRLDPEDAAQVYCLGETLRALHSSPIPVGHDNPLGAYLQQKHTDVQAADIPTQQQRFAHRAVMTMAPITPVLLHGDLTVRNIRWQQDNIRLFDPYGMTGDPAYDLALATTMAHTTDKPAFLQALLAGYGSQPDNMANWLNWLAVYRLLQAKAQRRRTVPFLQRNLQERLQEPTMVLPVQHVC